MYLWCGNGLSPEWRIGKTQSTDSNAVVYRWRHRLLWKENRTGPFRWFVGHTACRVGVYV